MCIRDRFSGLPAGVTGNWAGNVVTISGTPTASGTFNYTVTTLGPCNNVSLNGTITVSAAPVGGSLTITGSSPSSNVVTSCPNANGSITLNGQTGTIDHWEY